METARSDIYKLGDELYLPGSSAMVVKRHAELMKELQNIPVDKLVASSSSLGKFGSNKTSVKEKDTGVCQLFSFLASNFLLLLPAIEKVKLIDRQAQEENHENNDNK